MSRIAMTHSTLSLTTSLSGIFSVSLLLTSEHVEREGESVCGWRGGWEYFFQVVTATLEGTYTEIKLAFQAGQRGGRTLEHCFLPRAGCCFRKLLHFSVGSPGLPEVPALRFG